MSGYGQLIYGIVCTEDTKDLFATLMAKRSKKEREQGYTLEESHGDVQLDHGAFLINAREYPPAPAFLYSFQVSASNGFEAIEASQLAKTEEYSQRIDAFLAALGIKEHCQPGWFLR